MSMTKLASWAMVARKCGAIQSGLGLVGTALERAGQFQRSFRLNHIVRTAGKPNRAHSGGDEWASSAQPGLTGHRTLAGDPCEARSRTLDS
jgi:hypothetical protein